MSPRKARLWLRSLFQKQEVEEELAEELRFHLESQIEGNMRSGMDPEEARRRARLAFGGLEKIKEECREARGTRWVEDFLQDFGYGLRMLRRSPGFTAVAVLTLALGIGLNTAIFSVVYGVLLRPLPFQEPDRILQIVRKSQRGFTEPGLTDLQFRFCLEHGQAFSYLAAYTGVGFNVRSGESALRLKALRVSADYFRVLGVSPELGRDFRPEDDRAGAEGAVLLSHGLWKGYFGGDPNVIGRPVFLDGEPYTVIGAMPPQASAAAPADLWTTLAPVAKTIGGGYNYAVIARLKPGLRHEQALAHLTLVSEAFLRERPGALPPQQVLYAQPYQHVLAAWLRQPLLVLFGAIAFVLLIACANVANLLLSRATRRSREIAVRIALGAGRGRLIRQLLTESVLLAALGGALGLLLARWGLDALLGLSPVEIPRLQEVRLDRWALSFTLFVAVLTGVLFGLAPALAALKSNLHEFLKEGAGQLTAGRRRGHLRFVLATSEIALSLVLVVGAGLLVKTLVNLLRVDPGIDPRKVLSVQVWLTGGNYNSTAAVVNYYRTAVTRLESLPGVESAAVVAAGLPLEWGGNTPMRVVGDEQDGLFSADYRQVTSNFFRTLGVPLRRGRVFAEADSTGSAPVAVVNERFVRQYLSKRDPLSAQVVIFPDSKPPFADLPREIIGVVGDVRSSLDEPTQPTVFIPAPQAPFGTTKLFQGWFPIHVLVRAAGNPLPLGKAVAQALAELDPSQPVGKVRTMEQVLAAQPALTFRQFFRDVIGLFAILALVLAAVGIYGVMAYSVAQRAHEIGIRMTLGARPGDIFRLILAHGLRVALAGVAVGAAAALLLARLLAGLLFGVSPQDPTTLVGAAAALAAVALAACYFPARRATRVDPAITLRFE